MSWRKGRTRGLLISLGSLLLLMSLLLLHPRARAATRLTPGFQPLEEDARVFFEPGAEVYARRFAEFLPMAVARVEECQGRPFKSDFRVYVCASHQSFSQYLAQRPDSPVRGMALFRDVWVSPLAFDFAGSDTHQQTITHELSHLHLSQQLGPRSIMGTVPTWFVEGLADWVADTGGEIVSHQDALNAFANGHHFVPDTKGRFLVPRRAKPYGVSWPMLHQQSRMFVEYLRDRDEGSFASFVVAVGTGERFDAAFREHFGESLDSVWGDFRDSLDGGPAGR